MTLKLINDVKIFRLESDLLEDLSLDSEGYIGKRDIPFTPSLVGWAIINRFYSEFSSNAKKSICVSLSPRRVE